MIVGLVEGINEVHEEKDTQEGEEGAALEKCLAGLEPTAMTST